MEVPASVPSLFRSEFEDSPTSAADYTNPPPPSHQLAHLMSVLMEHLST